MESKVFFLVCWNISITVIGFKLISFWKLKTLKFGNITLVEKLVLHSFERKTIKYMVWYLEEREMNVGRLLLNIKELVSLLEMEPNIGRGISRVRPVSSIAVLFVYIDCPPLRNRFCMLSAFLWQKHEKAFP